MVTCRGWSCKVWYMEGGGKKVQTACMQVLVVEYCFSIKLLIVFLP